MNLIKCIDKKDYDDLTKIYKVNSTRAIIFKEGKLVMIKYLKTRVYIYPGGNIFNYESNIDALKRSVKEEAGLLINEITIKEFGLVKELRKSKTEKDMIFETNTYYYIAHIFNVLMSTNINEDEKEIAYVSVGEALANNRLKFNSFKDIFWIEREITVLEELQKNTSYK